MSSGRLRICNHVLHHVSDTPPQCTTISISSTCKHDGTSPGYMSLSWRVFCDMFVASAYEVSRLLVGQTS